MNLQSYADLRAILQAWNDDLRKAEETLAALDDPGVKLPLHFGRIRIDFDGDGRASDDEVLWKLYARLNGQARVTPEQAREFLIAFDRGDVAWLRGYCHLLMAFGEFYLAHDGQELFDRTAHLFFARPETPFAFLRGDEAAGEGRLEVGRIADLIALIHLLRLPMSEPRRMSAALDHLRAMLALSRESWRFYMAEDDDDHEWIPNPKQAGVIPGVKITEEMVKGWTLTFLDEADDLLAGRKLVPFWRGSDGRGVNLHRVFIEPRAFDLVLWVQGTAAVPYLEQGELSTPGVWRRLQRIFRGEFLGSRSGSTERGTRAIGSARTGQLEGDSGPGGQISALSRDASRREEHAPSCPGGGQASTMDRRGGRCDHTSDPAREVGLIRSGVDDKGGLRLSGRMKVNGRESQRPPSFAADLCWRQLKHGEGLS